MAEPPCRPPSLTLSVHGAREGPAPRAQVSSLVARPCPLPGVSAPLGGVGSLPVPSSPDGITAVDLVKPRAKRPRAAAGRWRPGAGASLAVPGPAAPRPLLGLLGQVAMAPPVQKLQKQVSIFRSCTLCVQGSAQKQDVAVPPEKDPLQGLRCLRCGPFRAPCPGSLILSGAQTPSPSPHPLPAPKVAETIPTVALTRVLLSQGHEATDTQLPNAPVSQATGHSS